MKPLPIIATLIVGAACATMIGLGVWQLQRADWKAGLLAEYRDAANKPAMAFPAVPYPKDLPLFRKASGLCLKVVSWSAASGRNLQGQSGWSHQAQCSTGAEGPGMVVDAGWSRAPASPDWKGGEVSGVIAPDTKSMIRLISDTPLAAGLTASAPPSPEDIPNNHFGYAIQWFLFAGIAALIFVLALRRSRR
jgi:surfeit locus 1 family protein